MNFSIAFERQVFTAKRRGRPDFPLRPLPLARPQPKTALEIPR